MGNPIVERGPGVRVIASSSTWIEGEALRQLDATAAWPGMRSCVGLPDLHPGKGSPIGAAFLSEGVFYPSLVGSDIGCSVALWATDLALRRVKPERLALAMDGLDQPWEGDPEEVLAAHDLEPGLHDATLGTPGHGNHYIELAAVHEVVDIAAFEALGLERDKAVLQVHSGSRGLGEAVLRGHTERHGAGPLTAGSEEAAAYLSAHDAAVRWAHANRAVCAARTCEAVGMASRAILDVPHNVVAPMMLGGCQCWLHRKGAAPADAGPVLIPGSRGDLSWLVQPTADTEMSLRSLAHGAGRKMARHEAEAKLRGRYRRDELRRNPWGGRVVCGEDRLAWEEAPECYKPVASVVGDLVDAGLITLIAALRPLVTFKTSEGSRQEVRRDRVDWQRERRDARRERGRKQ